MALQHFVVLNAILPQCNISLPFHWHYPTYMAWRFHPLISLSGHPRRRRRVSHFEEGRRRMRRVWENSMWKMTNCRRCGGGGKAASLRSRFPSDPSFPPVFPVVRAASGAGRVEIQLRERERGVIMLRRPTSPSSWSDDLSFVPPE